MFDNVYKTLDCCTVDVPALNCSVATSQNVSEKGGMHSKMFVKMQMKEKGEVSV
jgi:hypothetical protein